MYSDPIALEVLVEYDKLTDEFSNHRVFTVDGRWATESVFSFDSHSKVFTTFILLEPHNWNNSSDLVALAEDRIRQAIKNGNVTFTSEGD